jgi:hypothetical protein
MKLMYIKLTTYTTENRIQNTETHVYKIINVPVFYMAQDLMILMQAISITRAIGRDGPWKSRLFLGPKKYKQEVH